MLVETGRVVAVDRDSLWVETIHTVDVSNIKPMIAKYCCKGKKPKRFGPEVVSGKVMYPRIYEKNIWCVAFH